MSSDLKERYYKIVNGVTFSINGILDSERMIEASWKQGNFALAELGKTTLFSCINNALKWLPAIANLLWDMGFPELSEFSRKAFDIEMSDEAIRARKLAFPENLVKLGAKCRALLEGLVAELGKLLLVRSPAQP